jgi:hypothetical protein
MEDVQYIYNAWKEVYTLTMKAGGKELDPRYFDHMERNAFNKSDQEEWGQWSKNTVVKIRSLHPPCGL